MDGSLGTPWPYAYIMPIWYWASACPFSAARPNILAASLSSEYLVLGME